MTLDISNKLINKFKGADLFNYLDIKYYDKNYTVKNFDVRKDFGTLVHGLNLIQFNLREIKKQSDNGSAKTWNNYEKFYQLYNTKNYIGVKYFIGILYHQDKNYWDNTGIDFHRPKDILDSTVAPIFSILMKLQNLDNDDKLYDKGYSEFIQLVFDVIIESQKINKIELFNENTLQVTQSTIDIYKSI